MNTNLERIIEYIKPYLLTDIVIRTNKKVLKKGKLKIFQVKQHYIRLLFEHDNIYKPYELPYPFDVTVDNKVTMFNYHISSFAPTADILLQTKLLDTSLKSKIYDNTVFILPSKEN